MANPRYQPIETRSNVPFDADTTFDDDIPNDVDDGSNIRSSSSNIHHRHDHGDWTTVGCFWILGLLNNASYVIMLASAKTISEGGTGLVFLTTVSPSLLIKLTAPYWFDMVSYPTRLGSAALFMAVAFAVVASSRTLPWQLLGVAFISVAGGLGEPCLLALAGRFDHGTSSRVGGVGGVGVMSSPDGSAPLPLPPLEEKGRLLTAFASGTGFAGVFGYFWKWFWNDWLGLTMSTTLWLALCIPCGYWSTFRYVMTRQHSSGNDSRLGETAENGIPIMTGTYLDSPTGADSTLLGLSDVATSTALTLDTEDYHDVLRNRREGQAGVIVTMPESRPGPLQMDDDVDDSACCDNKSHEGRPPITTTPLEISKMNSIQRFHLVMSLWPYTIPLFVVYAAEYTLQSGTWTAIGFPVDDVESRKRFYQYSNWLYQAGVFVSRSSGTIFTVPMAILWLMPTLQVLNVVIYWMVAANQHDFPVSIWHSPTFLYSAAFYTGLLGGAVYIHGYKRICKDVPIVHREFALSATSVAESFGILMADLSGLVIQACLYRINQLDGALLTCPF